jgi:GAF domain-containing protein
MAAKNGQFARQMRRLHVRSLIFVPLIARGRKIGAIAFARCNAKRYDEKDLALAILMAERSALAIDNAKLYMEAQDAIRLREDVLAVVSHDLRNPLGVVRGFNEIIAERILRG